MSSPIPRSCTRASPCWPKRSAATIAPVEDLGNPSSYLALQPGVVVVSSDGKELGKIEHILADPDADIFDGIVLDTSVLPGGHRFVDAPQVDEVYEHGVVL